MLSQKRCDGKSYSCAKQLTPHQNFFCNNFLVYSAGNFQPKLFCDHKEFMLKLGKSSRMKWLLVWASIAHFDLSENINIFKDNIKANIAWYSWAYGCHEGRTNKFPCSKAFPENKTELGSSHTVFPSLVIIFMGDKTLRYRSHNIWECLSFPGINGTMLYKATWNHTEMDFF